MFSFKQKAVSVKIERALHCDLAVAGTPANAATVNFMVAGIIIPMLLNTDIKKGYKVFSTHVVFRS